MIDLHCHVLPGIDDGPSNTEEAVALARDAAAAGTKVLVGTPHVNRRYANDAIVIGERAAGLSAELATRGVEVEIMAGAEIALSRAVEMDAEQLSTLNLGDGPWLLVEPPFTPFAGGLDILLLELQRRGHRIVLAHPERCPAVQRDPHMLSALVQQGVLTSITAGSLVGRFGSAVRRFAMSMVQEGLVHNVASDAHDRRGRPPGIAAELAYCGLSGLADWWTEDVPQAILDGGAIPLRPREVLLPAPSRGVARRRWRPRLAGRASP